VGALQAEHYSAAELALTYAHERGLDVAHLLAVVRLIQNIIPGWKRLQWHADMLGAD
jgi:hypothetical protein